MFERVRSHKFILSYLFTYQSPLAHKTCLGRLGKPVHGDSFRRARGRQGHSKASRSTRGSRLMDQSFGASLTLRTTPSRRICRSDGVSAFRPLRFSFPAQDEAHLYDVHGEGYLKAWLKGCCGFYVISRCPGNCIREGCAEAIGRGRDQLGVTGCCGLGL